MTNKIIDELRNPKGTSGSDFNATYWLRLANQAADHIEQLEVDVEVAENRLVKAKAFGNDALKRIEQLEAALKEKNAPLYAVVRVHKGEIPDGEIYGVPIMCDGERIFPRLGNEYDLYVARTALEGKKDE